MNKFYQIAGYFLCIGVFALIGWTSIVLSLSSLAPGGDLTFTTSQIVQSYIGQTIWWIFMLPFQPVFWLFPSPYLLTFPIPLIFCSIIWGSITYLGIFKIHHVFKTRPIKAEQSAGANG